MSEFEFERGREAGVKWGERFEQERLIEMLIANKVIRRDALGSLVFVNCDTLAVEYLPEAIIKGDNND